ncbi:MAG: 4Fe-4S binding protein [Prevotella sp.]|nr:4Fe-4S binding protein [Prevotella sp.]
MVYYFSATGNTKFIASLLAKELGDEAVSITDNTQPSLACGVREKLRVGAYVLCFPVHGWRVPSIVVKFLKAHSLNKIEGSIYVVMTCGDDCGKTFRYLRKTTDRLGISIAGAFSVEGSIYVVMTCGDDCGKTFHYLRKTTDRLGISIAGAFSVKMPESYVGLPFMDVDKKDKEQQKIAEARKRVPQIAAAIKAGKRGVYEVHEGACAYLKSKIIGGFFHHVLITDKTFSVNADACIGCGKCVEVCQVDNMTLSSARKPTWKHTDRCLTCLACYHICPRHAISFNGMTKGKGQYFLRNEE